MPPPVLLASTQQGLGPPELEPVALALLSLGVFGAVLCGLREMSTDAHVTQPQLSVAGDAGLFGW